MCIIPIFQHFPAYPVCCVCGSVACAYRQNFICTEIKVLLEQFIMWRKCVQFSDSFFRFSSFFRSGRVKGMVLLSSVLYQRMCVPERERAKEFAHVHYVGDILPAKTETQCIYIHGQAYLRHAWQTMDDSVSKTAKLRGSSQCWILRGHIRNTQGCS